jgi:hypothetical protein
LDEIFHPHSYSYPNERLPPRVPSRGMYDRLNPVSVTPDFKEEVDDIITNKGKYRNRIRKLQMSIRPIGNKKSSNSPDYDQIQKTNLYRSLIPYYTNEDDINERVDLGPDYDFNWVNNHNHNYSDFIHEFDQIYPPNFNDFFLHPPDYNNQLLLPPTQGNIIHPPNPPRQVPRNFSFTDPALGNNYIQPLNLPNSTTQQFLESLRRQRTKKKKKKKR